MGTKLLFTEFYYSLRPRDVVVFLGLISFVWIAVYGIYHAYFHPLSRYPGPKLWAAYRIPHAISAMRGKVPQKVLELHRKYGPVVRIAPDELAFTDSDAWMDIYGIQKGRVQNKKDHLAYPLQIDSYEHNIIFANDSKHAQLRRIYGPAFTLKALEEQTALLMKYADLLITQLKAAVQKNPVQDMSAWYNFTTFDLTGEFAFGEAFHCLDRGGVNHFFVKAIFQGLVTGQIMSQLERYGILSLLLPLMPKSFTKPKEDMDRYVRELVDRRRGRGYIPGVTDVFNYILLNKNQEDQPIPAEMYENGLTLVSAGSETTATLLTATTYFMCAHPEKLRKAKEEVRAAFKDESEITLKSVNDLSYMIAVLSESLRLFPPVGFGLPRYIVSKGGQTVAGYPVPEKTLCSIYHHAAYRYEANFARPEEFIPERWLSDAPPEFANDKRQVVQPFMVGPRTCLGKNLAYAEMRLLMAKMLWHFDFEIQESSVDWCSNAKAYIIWDKGHLNIGLKPVER